MVEQVLLTGISGFIAKHVALSLLSEGYGVRGTVRSLARSNRIRDTLANQGVDTSNLSFVEADLTSDSGWAEAVENCRFVQHVASPFPIEQPRNREALVPAARQGTLRVLEAARKAEVERIVLTSSMAAMMYAGDRPKEFSVSENDWTDPEWRGLSPYQVSKTRAEKAAWVWAKEHGWTDRLVVINPGFVLGPTLDGTTGTSLDVIKLIMQGAYPAVPPVSFPIVDVRDVADVHVEAMKAPGVAGRRLIAAHQTRSMSDMARTLKSAFPDHARKAPTRELPSVVVRLLSLFDKSLKSVLPDLGYVPTADSSYVTHLTGVTFRGADEAIREAGRSLVDTSAL